MTLLSRPDTCSRGYKSQHLNSSGAAPASAINKWQAAVWLQHFWRLLTPLQVVACELWPVTCCPSRCSLLEQLLSVQHSCYTLPTCTAVQVEQLRVSAVSVFVRIVNWLIQGCKRRANTEVIPGQEAAADTFEESGLKPKWQPAKFWYSTMAVPASVSPCTHTDAQDSALFQTWKHQLKLWSAVWLESL